MIIIWIFKCLIDVLMFCISVCIIQNMFVLTNFSLICVRYVGKMSRKENETPEEFGVRVQAATASALQLSTSNHTVADKV